MSDEKTPDNPEESTAPPAAPAELPESTPPAVVDAVATPQAASESEAPIIITRPRSHAPWAFALVMVSFIASGTFLAWNFLPSVRTAQRDATAAISQGSEAAAVVYEDLKAGVSAVAAPKVERQTIINAALGALSSEGKLVVLTRTLPVDIEKRASYRVWWDQLELDGSVVRVRVNNNRVQYVVPLEGLAPESFDYIEAENKLVATLPEPRLDHGMIAIASSPEDWHVDKAISYARLHDWWGTDLLDEARAEIRGLVAAAAEEPLIQKEAREKGYELLAQLLQSAAAPFAPGVSVEVRFEQEAPRLQENDAWPQAPAPLS